MHMRALPKRAATGNFNKDPWHPTPSFSCCHAEMYGALEAVASGPAQAMAAPGSSIVGVGMCPEGIEQNPVVYNLFSEWAFRCCAASFVASPGCLARCRQDFPSH